MRTALWSLVLILLATLARAGDRFEMTVFGGVSLLDVGRDQEVFPPCLVPLDPPPSLIAPCGPIFERQSLGGSLVQGASFGYRVTPRAALAGIFSIAPSHHASPENYGSDDSVVAYHFDAAFEYDLARPEGDVRPFLSLGAGRIEYRGDQALGDDRGDWSLNVGLGSSFKAAERVRVRLEVVDHVVPDHALTRKTAHDVHILIGLTVRP
jgi:hypothetical protein